MISKSLLVENSPWSASTDSLLNTATISFPWVFHSVRDKLLTAESKQILGYFFIDLWDDSLHGEIEFTHLMTRTNFTLATDQKLSTFPQVLMVSIMADVWRDCLKYQ